MKKLLYTIFILLAAYSLVAGNFKGEAKLVILHTNDTHGHALPFANTVENGGGAAARLTMIKDVRKNYDNVLVLDAGDVNTGRPESDMFDAEPDLTGMNEMGYDAMTLGNHEFDKPLNILNKQMKMAKFPFLCANIKKADGSLLTKPYMIKEFKNGLKVAVLGLTTSETATVGNPDIVKDLIIQDEVEAANEYVSMLRDSADVVVALVHMGLYGEENGSMVLAKNVRGLDLIIDGHSHTLTEKPITAIDNGTYKIAPIVQAGQWGSYVGKAEFELIKGKAKLAKWEAVPINYNKKVKNAEGRDEVKYFGNSWTEDKKLAETLQPYLDKANEKLSEKIGVSAATYENKDTRKKETEIANLVCDAMLWKMQTTTGADFAINNGGGIRTSLPEGDITLKHIFEVLPFDNTLATATLKGSDVVKLFEYAATIENGKGAFTQVSQGVKFTINYATKTISDLTINDLPVDKSKEYKIATNNYLMSGGDGYVIFKKAIKNYDSSILQRDVLSDYIKTKLNGNISSKIEGRITLNQ